MDQKQMMPSHPLIGLGDMERMSVAIAKSGLFGTKTPEQALALMLIAQAEGLHPAAAARDYHVIDGKVALKADAMLARFQQAGGKVAWNAYTDEKVSGTFTHPAGGSATIEWTLAQADSAGLTRKAVWRQYPRAMLRARVISEGIRTIYPGVSVGVYTPEEIQDFDAKPAPQEVKAEPVAQPEPKSSVEIQTEILPSFDRSAAFKTLGSGRWEKAHLATYAKKAWGVESAKQLTDDQLKLFVSVVRSTAFETAILEVDPEFEVDVPL